MNRTRNGGVRIALALLLALAAAPLPLLAGEPQSAGEPQARFDDAHLVGFPGLVPPLDLPRGRPNPIRGYLFRPAGPGPFPAVVLLTGCRGVNQFTGYRRWVDRIVSWDYVVLVVDSLETRGLAFCNQRVDRATSAGDAYGAYRYLAGQSFVESQRIGLVGYSFGATSLLFAIESDPVDHTQRAIAAQFPQLAQFSFRAAIAFYPTSLLRRQRFSVPLLLLDGDGDRRPKDLDLWWMVELGRRDGNQTQFHIYPLATHSFDMESGDTKWDPEIRFDPKATADAAVRVHDFLDSHLKGAG